MRQAFSEPPQHSSTLMRSLAIAILIDVLILPYFRFLIMPLSLPVAVAGALFLVPFERDPEVDAVLVLAVVVFASASLSTLFMASDAVVANAKRAIQLLSTFSYFFLFRWMAARFRIPVTKVLVAFMLYFGAWMVVWLSNPVEGTRLLGIVYPTGGFMATQILVFLRYPYMFSDPNTAAYFFLIAAGLLALSLRKPSFARVTAIIAACAIVSVVTQSRGALLALVVTCSWLVFEQRVALRRPASLFAIVAVLATVIVAIWHSGIVSFDAGSAGSKLLRFFQARIATNEETWTTGRSDTYYWALTHKMPLVLGQGYSMYRDGQVFPPHSDHLRMIYSYGIIAWVASLMFFFRDARKAYPVVVPAFIAYSINSLIDEQKLLALFLVALGTVQGLDRSILTEQVPTQAGAPIQQSTTSSF